MSAGESATSEGQTGTDWRSWYLDTLDALVVTIERAEVAWATNSAGEPWVIAGDRIGSIPGTPCAFVLRFQKRGNDAESSPHAEYHDIEAQVAVLIKGDPKAQQGTLRAAIETMGAVENALYANRSLSGTCRDLWVSQATPFDAPADSGALAGAGITVEITKTAEHER